LRGRWLDRLQLMFRVAGRTPDIQEGKDLMARESGSGRQAGIVDIEGLISRRAGF
jgi:hypothetical protein